MQITNTLPRRRTILQSRCRCLADLSEDRTFMTISNQVRRRKLEIVTHCGGKRKSCGWIGAQRGLLRVKLLKLPRFFARLCP